MRALLLTLVLALGLSGCVDEEPEEAALDADPGEADPQEKPEARNDLAGLVLFDDRLEATGAWETVTATFEVPEGAYRLTLRAGSPDDVAVGNFRVVLENPKERTWEVYSEYGVVALDGGSTASFGGEQTILAKATSGTWTLHATTIGHMDLGFVVELV